MRLQKRKSQQCAALKGVCLTDGSAKEAVKAKAYQPKALCAGKGRGETQV